LPIKQEKWKRSFTKIWLCNQENGKISARIGNVIPMIQDMQKRWIQGNIKAFRMEDLPPKCEWLGLWIFNSLEIAYRSKSLVGDKKLTRSELITYRNVDGKELKGILLLKIRFEIMSQCEKNLISIGICVSLWAVFWSNGYNRILNLDCHSMVISLFALPVDLEMGYPGELGQSYYFLRIN